MRAFFWTVAIIGGLWGAAAMAAPASGATGLATKPGETAIIDADKLEFDRSNNIYLGTSNVVVQYLGAVLRAEKVRFNSATKEAWAEGNVRLTRYGVEWAAPAAYYNFETQRLKTDLARGTVDGLYLRAEGVDLAQGNRMDVVRLTLTTCDYDQPHYRIEAKRAEIWMGRSVTLYGATVYMGRTPVFWFPIIVWSLLSDTPPFAVNIGHNNDWGFYVLTHSRWQINRHLSVGVQVDGRTSRGPGIGPDLKYRYGNAEGLLRAYYAHDISPTDRIDQLAGASRPNDRYTAHWEHRQPLFSDVTLTINLNKQGDPDVREDFFPREFRLESEPESVTDATWSSEAATLSLLTRPQFNHFYAEVERLPEVKLAVNRLRLWRTPLFYEGETSAGYYDTQDGPGSDPLFVGHTFRADTFHQLLAPHQFFHWLSIVPHAGIRATYYLDAPTGAADTNEIHRVVANAGLEASVKFWKQWDDIVNDRLQIHKLRHIIEPFTQFEWVSNPTVRPWELYQFDTVRYAGASGTTLPVTRYTAVDFPANSAIDAIDGGKVLRFGVRQRLQTQRAGQTWNLAELDTWTDWRIEKPAGESEIKDVYHRLRFRPFAWLAGELDVRWDAAAGRWEEINTAARLAHGDRWAIGLGTRYLRDDTSPISLDGSLRLTRFWTVRVYERFNARSGRWEEQEYVLRQETHDWFINYGVRYSRRYGEGDDFGVIVSFTLKAFPEVKIGTN
jgi:LPS-assembly protein